MSVPLPPGIRLRQLGDVGSTNAEALALAAVGEPTGLWVTARAQLQGRGRGRRGWSSPPGNLYASLLLRPAGSLAVAQQLTLLAPVALYEAVTELLAIQTRDARRLRLKWPNDVLLGGAKVSGILLESAISPDHGLAVVMGFGLNLASHPDGLDQPATHLGEHGFAGMPSDALEKLAAATAAWLERWDEGRGFAAIRLAWMERAGPLGEPLSVRVSADPAVPRVEGRFAGLDEAGALLLTHADGPVSRHYQGDVALRSQDR